MIRFERPIDPHFLRSAWPFWYVATVYTRHPGGQACAYDEAMEAKGILFKNNVPVFVPVTDAHEIAMRTPGLDPLDSKRWTETFQPFLFISFGLIVVKMKGWDASEGIAQETEDTRRKNRPILYMEWPQ